MTLSPDSPHSSERNSEEKTQVPYKTAHAVFARLLRVLEPYAEEIVLIGGWVHALYLADSAISGKIVGLPIITDDVDVTIPRKLHRDGRPPLLDLISEAGFERDPISDIDGATILLRQIAGTAVVDLDLLTEIAPPGTPVRIEGQEGLLVSGYPGQAILLENTQWMEIGVALHATLDPPVRIRVPTLPAYVFHKGLSSSQRLHDHKRAKDLVYMAEILRHPLLGSIAYAGLRGMALQYPAHYADWERHMARVISNDMLLRRVADQLLSANRAIGTETEVGMAVARRLQRALLVAAGKID